MLYKCVRFYETGISVPMFQSVFKHRYAHHSTVEYTRFIGSWLRYHLYNSVVDHVVYFPLFIQHYTTGDREEARAHNSEPLGTPMCTENKGQPCEYISSTAGFSEMMHPQRIASRRVGDSNTMPPDNQAHGNYQAG